MKIYYADTVPLLLPAGHRFPAEKYPRLRQRVFESQLFSINELIEAQPASKEQLLKVHTPEYLEKVMAGTLSEREQRRIGLPWTPELVDRSRRSVGGTIAACLAAAREGMAAYLGGGTHHAYPDHGEGFCVFNDIAVAVRELQARQIVQKILILDCDVHQGNGTAFIFSNDANVFTFSIHGEKNFPFHKEQSSLDIVLPDGSGDQDFLDALERGVATSMANFRADLAVYIAGADPFSADRFGRLAMTKAGLLERDRLVFEYCLAVNLPLAIVMGGGYANQIEDIVDIHFQTISLAYQYSQRYTGLKPL
jgi:acetoin utilization deacetylase AcuC-like enzyme